MKKIIILALFLVSLVAISANAALPEGQFVIGYPTCIPASPTPRSTVTFSVVVAVTSGTIDGVYLIYQECNATICGLKQNVSMTLKNNFYQCNVTFTKADTTHVIACAKVKSGTTWKYGWNATINFSSNNNNNNNSNNTNGTGKKSPGFEVLPVIAAVAIALILIRRKRS